MSDNIESNTISELSSNSTPLRTVKRKTQTLSPKSSDINRQENAERAKKRRLDIKQKKELNADIFQVFIDNDWQDINNISVIRLKAELKSHKITNSGTKQELINKLKNVKL